MVPRDAWLLLRRALSVPFGVEVDAASDALSTDETGGAGSADDDDGDEGSLVLVLSSAAGVLSLEEKRRSMLGSSLSTMAREDRPLGVAAAAAGMMLLRVEGPSRSGSSRSSGRYGDDDGGDGDEVAEGCSLIREGRGRAVCWWKG